jgi:thiamine pyrophosphokinase
MVLIFANGDLVTEAWLRPYLQQATVIIAANGGLAHIHKLGLSPDWLVGDMDSLTAEQKTAVAHVKKETYPTDKDETDLELALLYAIEQYPGVQVGVVAAFGGRIDQTVANLLLLTHPRLQNQPIVLLSPHQRSWLLTPSSSPASIEGAVGDLVSLLPLGGDALVAYTDGLHWPLVEERLAFGPARGVSNKMTAATATVALTSGQLLIVHTDGVWQR